MKLIKFLFSLFLLMAALAVWPVTLVIIIFLGLMKVGMKQDFEP